MPSPFSQAVSEVEGSLSKLSHAAGVSPPRRTGVRRRNPDPRREAPASGRARASPLPVGQAFLPVNHFSPRFSLFVPQGGGWGRTVILIPPGGRRTCFSLAPFPFTLFYFLFSLFAFSCPRRPVPRSLRERNPDPRREAPASGGSERSESKGACRRERSRGTTPPANRLFSTSSSQDSVAAASGSGFSNYDRVGSSRRWKMGG